MITIRRLIWDDWNTTHISRHGIVPEDVEQVCRGDFLARLAYDGRLMVIGVNASGALISAILAPKTDGE